jgi:hypothetical protein
MEQGFWGAVVGAVLVSLIIGALNLYLQRDSQKHATKSVLQNLRVTGPSTLLAYSVRSSGCSKPSRTLAVKVVPLFGYPASMNFGATCSAKMRIWRSRSSRSSDSNAQSAYSRPACR